MILTCSGCSARYRLDERKLSSATAVVRCRKCGTAMPVAPPAPSPAPRAAPAPAPRTALLADEAREFRDLVRGELEAAGFEVSVTDDGEEALLLAGSHPFDLIVLNAYLRRLPGIHVCERIKANPGLTETPVILMGELLRPARGARRGVYGADDFITTSISREELSERLRRLAAMEGAEAPEPPRATTPPRPAPATRSRTAFPAPDPSRSPEEEEIRRLARIMISDIEVYHPEKFTRALRDGTFFEAFAEDLGRGKELIDQRFGHLPNRIQLLAAGLRDALEVYRQGPAPRKTSFA